MRMRTPMSLGFLAVVTCLAADRAAGQTLDAAPTIVVQGVGSVELDPDFVEITLGVESQAATAEMAADSMSTRLDAVADTLNDLGFPADSFPQTTFAVSPRYDLNASREVVGFQAAVVLTLRTTDLDGLPELIGAALAVGATTVRNITFRSTQEEAGHDDALRLAYDRARHEAEVIASAAGLRLGEIRLITTQPLTGGLQLRAFTDMPAPAISALAVQPEKVVERAAVTIHWALLPR